MDQEEDDIQIIEERLNKHGLYTQSFFNPNFCLEGKHQQTTQIPQGYAEFAAQLANNNHTGLENQTRGTNSITVIQRKRYVFITGLATVPNLKGVFRHV